MMKLKDLQEIKAVDELIKETRAKYWYDVKREIKLL